MNAFNYLLVTIICLSGQLTASAQSPVLGGTATHIKWDAPICTKVPGMKNRLTWTTAETIPTKYYEVLRSPDGKNFTSIGIIPATNENAGNYVFEDEKPLTVTYYQVCSVTSFGIKTYSTMIKATINSESIAIRMGYSSSTLIFRDNSARVITLINSNGQPLTSATTNNSQHTINTYGLSKGIYVVRIDEGAGKTQVKKIMVL